MKYEITYEKNDMFQVCLCKAPTAEIAQSYFESLKPSADVIGVSAACTIRPGEPLLTVPNGWTPDPTQADDTDDAKASSRYDLQSIMGRAWDIRKAAAADIGCKVSEVVLSLCLKQAWAEARAMNDLDNAAVNASAVINEWEALGGDGQIKMMKACIRKAAKNAIKYSTEDHYLQFSEVPAWYMHGHDFDEFVSETWLRAANSLNQEILTFRNEMRAKECKYNWRYKAPMTLISTIYNAARASIAAIYEQDIKHDRARSITLFNDDGEEYDYFDALSAADNTEQSAIIRTEVRRYYESRDDVDQEIMARLPLGYTERQIGAVVGMSGPAIHKRIVKMRDDLGFLMEA